MLTEVQPIATTIGSVASDVNAVFKARLVYQLTFGLLIGLLAFAWTVLASSANIFPHVAILIATKAIQTNQQEVLQLVVSEPGKRSPLDETLDITETVITAAGRTGYYIGYIWNGGVYFFFTGGKSLTSLTVDVTQWMLARPSYFCISNLILKYWLFEFIIWVDEIQLGMWYFLQFTDALEIGPTISLGTIQYPMMYNIIDLVGSITKMLLKLQARILTFEISTVMTIVTDVLPPIAQAAGAGAKLFTGLINIIPGNGILTMSITTIAQQSFLQTNSSILMCGATTMLTRVTCDLTRTVSTSMNDIYAIYQGITSMISSLKNNPLSSFTAAMPPVSLLLAQPRRLYSAPQDGNVPGFDVALFSSIPIQSKDGPGPFVILNARRTTRSIHTPMLYGSIWSDIGDGFKNIADKVLTPAEEMVKKYGGRVLDGFNAGASFVINGVSYLLGDFWDIEQQVKDEIVSTIINPMFADFQNKILDKISSASSEISYVDSIKTQLEDAVKTALEKTLEIVTNFFSRKVAGSMLGDITSFLDNSDETASIISKQFDKNFMCPSASPQQMCGLSDYPQDFITVLATQELNTLKGLADQIGQLADLQATYSTAMDSFSTLVSSLDFDAMASMFTSLISRSEGLMNILLNFGPILEEFKSDGVQIVGELNRPDIFPDFTQLGAGASLKRCPVACRLDPLKCEPNNGCPPTSFRFIDPMSVFTGTLPMPNVPRVLSASDTHPVWQPKQEMFSSVEPEGCVASVNDPSRCCVDYTDLYGCARGLPLSVDKFNTPDWEYSIPRPYEGLKDACAKMDTFVGLWTVVIRKVVGPSFRFIVDQSPPGTWARPLLDLLFGWFIVDNEIDELDFWTCFFLNGIFFEIVLILLILVPLVMYTAIQYIGSLQRTMLFVNVSSRVKELAEGLANAAF